MCKHVKHRLVKFIQFTSEQGVKEVFVERPEPIAQLADDIWGFGWTLEGEKLSTGEIALACESHDELLGTIALKIYPNNSAIPDRVDEIVVKAHNRLTAHIERTRYN